MEALFWRAAGPLIGDDEPSAVLLAGMMVCAADGMLVNVADTPANRKAFGCAGTTAQDGDGSAPFPQVRIVALTARAGRAMLGAILRPCPGRGTDAAGPPGPPPPGPVRRPGDLLRPEFPRLRPDHRDPARGRARRRPGEGRDQPADGPGRRLAARRIPPHVAERAVREERRPAAGPRRRAQRGAARGGGEEVSETCTLITTLLDHQAAPAAAVREAYLTRWSASETTFGEDKATITGAGNRTSGPVLRSGSPRLVIQEAWAWLTATQLVRVSAAAALHRPAAQARALRRKDSAPVTADEESFTAARHHAIRSMTSSQVTASSSLDALAAAADAAARAALHTLNVPGRERHSQRAQKARPKFRHTAATKQTVTGKPQVTVFAASWRVTAARQQDPSGRRNRPARRGRGPWNRAPPPPRHAGKNHARTSPPPPRKQTQRQAQNTRTVTGQHTINT